MTIRTYQPTHNTPISTTQIPDRIQYSYSANVIMADFSGFETTMQETLNYLNSMLFGIEGLKFSRQGKSVEISFKEEKDADYILEEGLIFKDRQLLISKAFHPDKKIYSISVFGLPFRLKEDTNAELTKVFSRYARLLYVKYNYYTGTSMRMDSCNVILDFSNTNNIVSILP